MFYRPLCIALLMATLSPIQLSAQEKKVDPKVAALIKALRGKTTTDKVKAAEGLEKLGPEARDATRAICDAVLDPSRKVRNAALNALEKINPDLHEVVAPLALDENPSNRLDAVERIQKMGANGKPATSLVIASYGNPARPTEIGSLEEQFKQQAIDTLIAVGPEDKEVVDALIFWLLADQDSRMRDRCAEVLPQTHIPKRTVPALLKAMSAGIVRLPAVEALGEIGADAKTSVKALANVMVTDPDAAVRLGAIRALERIDPGAKDFLKALEKSKFDPDAAVRKASEEALKNAQEKQK
jgi:HEAT repeat protein